jgi:hypothetical protein
MRHRPSLQESGSLFSGSSQWDRVGHPAPPHNMPRQVLSPEYAARSTVGAAPVPDAAVAADADAEAPSTPPPEASGEGGAATPGAAPGTPHKSTTTTAAAGEGIGVADAAAEAEAEARRAEAKRDADKARLAAAAASLAPPAAGVGATGATAGALSDAAALAVLRVLRLAVVTARPPLVEVALDLLHKLIALRFLQGAAHSVSADRGDASGTGSQTAGTTSGGGAEGNSGDGARAPTIAEMMAQTPQAVAVELICKWVGQGPTRVGRRRGEVM